jgi:hypothetical protein
LIFCHARAERQAHAGNNRVLRDGLRGAAPFTVTAVDA